MSVSNDFGPNKDCLIFAEFDEISWEYELICLSVAKANLSPSSSIYSGLRSVPLFSTGPNFVTYIGEILVVLEGSNVSSCLINNIYFN